VHPVQLCASPLGTPLETNTDPDPDPIRIQGFNDQKLKKNNS
jgi:hypothetical protein